MEKIYILHEKSFNKIAESIKLELNKSGLDVITKSEAVQPGQNVTESLISILKDTKIVIILVPGDLDNADGLDLEISSIVNYSKIKKGMLILPIKLNGTPTFSSLASRQHITINNFSLYEKISEEIIRAINAHNVILDAENSETQKKNENLEKNAALYIKDTLIALNQKENDYKKSAKYWLRGGILILLCSLISSIGFAFYSIKEFPNPTWEIIVTISIRNMVILVLAIITARYANQIGNKNNEEANRVADRVHAISYGEFYLRAFGKNANWEEVKEVLQYWNIDRNEFIEYDRESDYDEDPKKMINFFKELATVYKNIKQ